MWAVTVGVVLRQAAGRRLLLRVRRGRRCVAAEPAETGPSAALERGAPVGPPVRVGSVRVPYCAVLALRPLPASGLARKRAQTKGTWLVHKLVG